MLPCSRPIHSRPSLADLAPTNQKPAPAAAHLASPAAAPLRSTTLTNIRHRTLACTPTNHPMSTSQPNQAALTHLVLGRSRLLLSRCLLLCLALLLRLLLLLSLLGVLQC